MYITIFYMHTRVRVHTNAPELKQSQLFYASSGAYGNRNITCTEIAGVRGSDPLRFANSRSSSVISVVDLPTVGRRLSVPLSICQHSAVVCQFCCRFANSRPSSVSSVVDLPTVGRRLSFLLSIWQTGGEVEMGFHGR